MTLVTPYLPDYVPQNESERVAGLASSNTNSLAVGAEAITRFRHASFGQTVSYATPTGASPASPGVPIASAAASTASTYAALTNPTHRDEMQTGLDAIVPTTGSGWQQVATVENGNQTAF